MADPVRLRLLLALQQGERCVSDLVALSGATQTNVSKHLMVLRSAGLVTARKAGLRVFHACADDSLHGVCEAACRGLQARLERGRAAQERMRRSVG